MVQTSHHTTHTDIVQGEDIITLQDFIFESEQVIAGRQALRIRLAPCSGDISEAFVANVKRSFLFAPDTEVVSLYGPFQAFTGQSMKVVSSLIPDTVTIREYRMLDTDHRTEALVTRERSGPSSSSFRIPIDCFDSEKEALLLDLPNLTTLIFEGPLDDNVSATPNDSSNDIQNRIIYTLGSMDTLISCSLTVDLLLGSYVVLEALRDYPLLSSLELTPPNDLLGITLQIPEMLSKFNRIVAIGLESLSQLQVLTVPVALVDLTLLSSVGTLKNLKTLRVRKTVSPDLPAPGITRVVDVLLSMDLSGAEYFKALEALELGVVDMEEEVRKLSERFPNTKIL